MAVAYCSINQWSERQGYANFAAYQADDNQAPDQEELEAALEDATDIMNDSDHIGTLATNVTDANYTNRLERICYNMANRMLDEERNRGIEGAFYRWSPQDYLFERERRVLHEIGVVQGTKVVGGVST